MSLQRERWTRLERLFADSLELPGQARSAFLDRNCADDPDLRVEVAELLSAHASSGVLDTGPGCMGAEIFSPSLQIGARVGAWQIERLIGRGGMGEVYAVIRVDAEFDQRAALKLLRYEASGQLERFHVERQILARLEHPHIARLLDGGMTEDARPYTVMEYVEGSTLTDYCRTQRPSLDERLALFMQICDAVAYAHRNLVIHRDLKPDNIMVDAGGAVKLLDFGIAKLVDVAALSREGDLTVAPFTPDYAAPEQLSGLPVTTGTDIYALGVLLFELLTGERPLRSRGLPAIQALKLVLERDPPSTSRTAQAQVDAPISARLLRGDLDAIVGKCLRKEAADRYETVIGLKADLERHQRRQPVLARSGTRSYVARRFLRRHWLPIGGLSLFVAAVTAAAIYANQARVRTELALNRADAVRNFVIDLFQQNDPEAGNGRTMTARELVDVGVRRIEIGFGDDADARIELLGVSGNLYRALGEFPRGAELLARRLELATAAYPVNDARTIEAQLDMAGAEVDAENFDSANTLLEQALVNTAPERADLPELRARILLRLADLEAERDNSAAAIDRVDQAIELLQHLPTTTPAILAKALAKRSIYMFLGGQIAESEQPLRTALIALETNPHDNFGTLLEVRESLGKVLTSLGRFDEAIPLLKTNTDVIRELYGDQHPALANALHQLASVLRQSGDARSAVPIFTEALRLYEHNYGLDHSYVATALTGLGQSLIKDGQHAQAIAALTQAHDIYLRTLGPLHTYTAISLIALADAHLSAGDVVEAENGYRAALTAFGKIGDGKHIYAEAARLGLGKALLIEHHYVEAEAALVQARERFATEFGADDRRSIESTVELVRCLILQDHHEQARALVEESERALAASVHDVRRQRALLDAARQELDSKGSPRGEHLRQLW